MKNTLLIILILTSTSIYSLANKPVRNIPSYIVDVKNYNLINSKKAYFIIGSRKYGTMEKNFAFAKKEDAQKYIEKNGGCVVDYDTYVKMNDAQIKKYVKKHGIKISTENNTTKSAENNITKTMKKKDPNSDIYSKENMKKYKF